MLTFLITALLSAVPQQQQQAISFWAAGGRSGHAQVWTMDAAGGGRRRVTNLFSAKRGDWSPDGQLILFYGVAGLSTIRPDGGGLRRLTRADDADPRWSLDGRRIAFTRWLAGNPEVYVMSAAGARQMRLTRSPVEDLVAGWSPDGRQILYSHGPQGAHQVYVMNADGSGKTNLSHSQTDDWATDWR